ncbi:DUF2125 domain-containing protein [Roseovarius sp. D22-M7]|uniref:DUF2125 domain-containing protein n=1 Tax=Roseovarius sp. D22-M7 TaxID=3127116 RepID=UPI00300FEAAA
MSHARLMAVTALAFGFGGSAAMAELTADQVWQDWTAYLADLGYEVSGDTRRSGYTLTIRDLALEMDMPDEEGAMSLRMGGIRLVENDDGSVSVVLPRTLPIAVAAIDDEAQQVTAAVEVAQEALDLRVSGTQDAMDYAYSADALTFALTGLQAGDETPEIRAAQIRLEDVTGSSESEPGDTSRAVSQDLRAGPVTYEVDISEPGEGSAMALSGSMAQVQFTGETSIPDSFTSDDVAAALREGFRFSSTVEYETGSTAYRFEQDGEVLEGSNSSARGRLAASMDPDGLSYGAAGEEVSLSANASDMPFPVNLDMARMAFDITMPVIESEEMQDYGVQLELSEFTMSDQLWSMVDPGARLPRDPATLRVDLSGTGRLFFDLLDPAEVEKLEARDSLPGEVESLTLNNLTLDAAGATLSGEGAFTFDADDTESFGGAPAPEGTLDLRLLGGNALLDKLVGMGLLPEEQASGARMMMGIFARPGDGEDELLSTIEVTDDGQILANGQRLK